MSANPMRTNTSTFSNNVRKIQNQNIFGQIMNRYTFWIVDGIQSNFVLCRMAFEQCTKNSQQNVCIYSNVDLEITFYRFFLFVLNNFFGVQAISLLSWYNISSFFGSLAVVQWIQVSSRADARRDRLREKERKRTRERERERVKGS